MRLTVLILTAAAAFAQSLPTFEVADLQPSKTANAPLQQGFLPGGRVELFNTTMRQMIMGAFNIGPSMLARGPDWLDADHFDLVAKAADSLSIDVKRQMLRALLIERCKLATHTEDRPVSVYLMTADKRPKLSPPTGEGMFTCETAPATEGMIHRVCRHIAMDDLAKVLPRIAPKYVDLPVVNLTELPGLFDVDLEWTPTPSTEPGTRTIFDAVSQLGLKLEQRKHPMPVVVIDHVERPR